MLISKKVEKTYFDFKKKKKIGNEVL